MITKLMAGAAAAAMLAVALPVAAQGYPYTYFTGTSYLVGPGYFMGGGGFSTGPTGIQSQPFNTYQAYGPGTFSYNPMTGQGNFGNSSYGQQYGYGSTMYGNTNTVYGSNNSYGYGPSGCNPYIPSNVCGLISRYTGYTGGGYSGYGYSY